MERTAIPTHAWDAVAAPFFRQWFERSRAREQLMNKGDANTQTERGGRIGRNAVWRASSSQVEN